MASKVEVLIEAKDKFSSTFQGFTKGLAPMAKGLGVVTAAVGAWTTALVANAKSVAAAYDEVQKFSDQLGVSTEFLSRMRVAANFSGVAVTTMDKAIQKLQVGLGEAHKGMGIARDTIEQLGLSIYKANGQLKTAEEIMPELADRIGNMTNATERAEAAQKLFGQRGIEMVQILKGGAEGLAALSAEADYFGVTISSEAGQNAAAFNDAIYRIQLSFQGLRNYLAEQTMPMLTDLANFFAMFVAEHRPQMIDFAEKVSLAMLQLAEISAYAVAGMIDAWRGLKMTWEVLKIVFLELSQTLTEGVDYLTEKFIRMLEVINVRGIFDDAIANARAFTDHNKEAIDVMEQMIQTSWDNLDAISSEGLMVERLAEFVEYAKEKFAELKEEGGLANALGVTDEDREKAMENAAAMTEGVLSYGYSASDEHKKLAKAEVDTEKKKQKGKFAVVSDFTVKGFNLTKVANLKETIMNTYAAAEGAYKALAGIPIVGPALAVAAAAAATAYGVAQQTGISSMVLSGVAHGGLQNVPREGTYLLDRGERVLAPEQNKDLTEALRGGLGGSFLVERLNLSVAENAINADSLLALDEEGWFEIVTDKIYPALAQLTAQGYKI